jgi:capsular polysaccharide transport system permease protein
MAVTDRSNLRSAPVQAEAGTSQGQDLVTTEAKPSEVVAEEVTFQGYFGRVSRRPAGALARRMQILVFLLVVGLPTLLAGIYYGFIASDQYVTDIQFGVRSADAQRNDASSMFQNSGAASQIAVQSNVVVHYIKSREMVEAVGQKFDLREAFSRPSADYFSRLDPSTSVEGLVEYWRGKVEPFFDLTTGIVSVRVRAFTPQDALQIGNDIVALSEKLADDLSKRSRKDFVKFAQNQVDEATARLTKVREALLQFRNQGQMLDPTKEGDAARLGIGKLREELARVQTDLTTARARLGDNAPTIIALKDRQAALQQQIQGAEARLASTAEQSGKPLSQDIRGYEALETERHTAEKFYETALESLQRAQFEANRQAMYLEVFVRPALAEQSLYPRRFVSTLIVALSAFGVWIFLLMAYHSVREHV